MNHDDQALKLLAQEQDTSIEAVCALLEQLKGQLGVTQYYVFWAGGSGESAQRAPRERTLLAFPAPDDAITFAQRNRLAPNPNQLRLRHLTLLHLLVAALRNPAISALLFVNPIDGVPLQAGRLPIGTRITRNELLLRLRAHQTI